MNSLQVPHKGPPWRKSPVSRAFFYMSLEFLNKSSPKKISPFSRRPYESRPPPMLPKTGTLWKQTPISRALLGISFRVRSKGALLPGSPHRAPTERCSVSRAHLHSSFKVTGTRALFQVSQQAPMERAAPFLKPSFNYLSKLPVNRPPRLPNGKRDPFQPSSTHPLITRLFLKVPSKVAPHPLHVHPTGSLWRETEMFCLQSQWFNHSFTSVRVPS